MDTGKASPPSEPLEPSASERLDSWKEIATYLKRDESTVRRWEKEGLPVHRHAHKKKATVYAYKPEVDVWWNDGRARLEVVEATAARRRRRLVWSVAAGLTLVAVGLVALNVGRLRDRLLGRPAAGEITSIAVLPLENLSGDPNQDYFADGMTEALITELGKISALRVISRTSVMQYKDTRKPLAQIGQELKVEAVVEGAVAREGDRVRVTVQLIEASTDRHLWAERYERDLTSILALQSEVARAVAREVKVTLTPAQETRLARAVDPEAHELYLRGRYHWSNRSREKSPRAMRFFLQAIEKDPAYAAPYSGLADVYIVQPAWGLAPPSEAFPRARAAALKALELDDNLPEAYATLAAIKEQYDRDWSGAEEDYKRALELNPNYATAHHWYGLLLSFLGKHEEAIAELQSAERLDPFSPIIGQSLGRVLYYARRYNRAAQQFRKTLEMHPEVYMEFAFLGAAYAQMGMHAEALAAAEKGTMLPEGDNGYGYIGWTYARSGRRGEALRLVRRLQELSSQVYVDPTSIATIHGELGQTKEAFTSLEHAYEERGNFEILTLKVNPVFDSLRDDPRFQDLLRRMNFPD